jgi:hypothetical protein
VRNGAVEIFCVDVGERAQIEIPLICVVGLKLKISILVFVGLLQQGIFKVVAFAQRAEVVIVVIHPFIDGRGLLADRLERRVRVEKGECGGKTGIGNTKHADVTIVIRDIFHKPVDGVVGVAGLVGGLGIVEVHAR